MVAMENPEDRLGKITNNKMLQQKAGTNLEF